MRYKVTVEQAAVAVSDVYVEADGPAEAEEKVMAMDESGLDWRLFRDTESALEVMEVEVD